MFKVKDKKELEIIRWLVWEKLIRNPEYRADYEKIWDHDEKGKRLFCGLKPEAEDYLCEKWNLPYPVDPDTDWEVIAKDRPGWLFDEHIESLDKYGPVRKRLVREIKWLFPDLFADLNDKTTGRFSTTWPIAYRAYDLCEIEGKSERDAAIILKGETKGKAITEDAVHNAKKRVWELVFNEPYTTKRERRKKYTREPGPCRTCESKVCETTGKACDLLEAWIKRIETLPDDKTPYRIDWLDDSLDDPSRPMRELAEYLAYPTCTFENPETGNSFVFHAPEAVQVFFHIPVIRPNPRLNSVFISKRVRFFYDP